MGMKKILYSFIISQLLIISVVSSVYAVEFESHQKIDCNNQEIKQNNNIISSYLEKIKFEKSLAKEQHGFTGYPHP